MKIVKQYEAETTTKLTADSQVPQGTLRCGAEEITFGETSSIHDAIENLILRCVEKGLDTSAVLVNPKDLTDYNTGVYLANSFNVVSSDKQTS